MGGGFVIHNGWGQPHLVQCAHAAYKILNEILKIEILEATVTYIYNQRKYRVEVTSVGLAHARPISLCVRTGVYA